MVEVGVAVRAFDADRVEGRIGLRLSAEGEGFEGRDLTAAGRDDRGGRREAGARDPLRPDRRGAWRAARHGTSPAHGDRRARRARHRSRGGPMGGGQRASGVGCEGARKRNPFHGQRRTGCRRSCSNASTFPRCKRRLGGRVPGPPSPPRASTRPSTSTTSATARADLRRQIAVHGGWRSPACSARPSRARASTSRCPDWAGPACSPSTSWRRSATGSPRASRRCRAELHDYAVVEQDNRELIERDARRSRLSQVGAALQRGHRRARLQELARQARAGECSACCWAGGGSRSPPVVP